MIITSLFALAFFAGASYLTSVIIRTTTKPLPQPVRISDSARRSGS